MLSMTIKDALTVKSDPSGHCLYMVRKGLEVLYVGQSLNPLKRLQQGHMRAVESVIGWQIKKNRPDSLLWTFEMLTVEDCELVIMEHAHFHYRSCWRGKLDPSKQKRLIDIAEGALIRCYHPTYNKSLNGAIGGFVIEGREQDDQPVSIDLDDNAVDYIKL